MLRRLLSHSRFDESTHKLYDAMVTQARQPVFYAEQGVPDTLDGRFEIVLLHALLTMRRLRLVSDGGADSAQSLFDLLFADFDRALREIGVGDLSVGKRIKQMGQAFYGRATALEKALDEEAGAAGALAAFLKRNTYGTAEPTDDQVAALARYVFALERHLKSLADDALIAGDVSFSGPESVLAH